MLHAVNSPTRFQNNQVTAIENVLVNNSILHFCTVLPLANCLYHEAKCLILNTFFTHMKVMTFTNRTRLITKDTIIHFQELLSDETWDSIC